MIKGFASFVSNISLSLMLSYIFYPISWLVAKGSNSKLEHDDVYDKRQFT